MLHVTASHSLRHHLNRLDHFHHRKATGNLKILHNVHRDDEGEYASTFEDAIKRNVHLKDLVSKVEEDLNPERVLQLFRCMSDEDCLLLDLPGRPEHLLLQVVPVAPVCIRPSVEMDSMGSNEDDVTMKLMVRVLHAVFLVAFFSLPLLLVETLC